MLEQEIFEFGRFRLNASERLFQCDGKPVPLEPKVFETLLALVRRHGRLVGKEELLQTVWPDSYVEESNLTRNISVLRRALGSFGGDQFIETVPKRGYRFVGEVRRAHPSAEFVIHSSMFRMVVEQEEGAPPADFAAAAVGVRVPPELPASANAEATPATAPLFPARTKLVAFALLLTTIAVVALFLLRAGPAPNINSIAVLPFVNVADDPELSYIAEGFADRVTSSLARMSGLRVMSRNAAGRLRGNELHAQVMGKRLGVDAVLTGRVERRGSDIGVSVELIDVQENSQRWGRQYVRSVSELPVLDVDLVRDLTSVLQVQGHSRPPVSTHNPQAYEAYLKGRHEINTLVADGPKRALAYFNRAAELDPNFALAFAGIAEAYAQMANIGGTFAMEPRLAYSEAKAAALKAIALDPQVAEAHASLAQIAMSYEWDWKGAERSFQRAIELNPNDGNARHWYSHFLIIQERFAESLEQSEAALALDPLDVGMTLHLGFHHFSARQYQEAERQLKKALGMNPNHAETHSILATVYQQTGRLEEALAAMQRSRELGGLDQRGAIGYMYALAGRRDLASRLLTELLDEGTSGKVSAYHVAKIYHGLGQAEMACAWLEKAFSARDSNLIGLKVDPAFDSLRSNARYQDLVKRLALQ